MKYSIVLFVRQSLGVIHWFVSTVSSQVLVWNITCVKNWWQFLNIHAIINHQGFKIPALEWIILLVTKMVLNNNETSNTTCNSSKENNQWNPWSHLDLFTFSFVVFLGWRTLSMMQAMASVMMVTLVTVPWVVVQAFGAQTGNQTKMIIQEIKERLLDIGWPQNCHCHLCPNRCQP